MSYENIELSCDLLHDALQQFYDSRRLDHFEELRECMEGIAQMAEEAMPDAPWLPNQTGTLPDKVGCKCVDYEDNSGTRYYGKYGPGLNWDRMGLPYNIAWWRIHRAPIITPRG